MTNTIRAVADMISKGIDYLTLLSKTSHVRRLRKAVDLGEEYIFKTEQLVKMTKKKEIDAQVKRLKKLKKKFFKYNQ